MGKLYGQPDRRPTAHPARPLVVDSQFSTTSVNNRVLVYQVPVNKKRPLLTISGIMSADFLPNVDPQQVMIGPAYAHPEAWVYLPLVNPSNLPRKMIVDLDHNRCDTLDAFLLRGQQRELVHLGTLFRRMPLVQRAIPVRAFALPFELAPHDSAGLLLRSRRSTGIHELTIALSTEKQFTIKRDEEESIRLVALSSAFFFMFTVFSLGLIFKHRLLIYFGLYVFPIGLGQLNYNYFFDAFPFPAWLGLNANSIGLFIIFATNCLFHTFGVAYIKSLNVYGRWHRYAVLFLVGANLIPMGLLLFPLTRTTNAMVTNASLILTTLNIGWLFYISMLGFRVKREKYLLITATLVFVPILYRTYVLDSPALSYSYFQPFYYLLLFGYLIVSLFRRELISQQMTEEKIRLVQGKLEMLRKSEIEQIGRNLHDQLGNTLASALGYLNLKEPRIQVARDMILDAINETRVISHNLVKDDNRPLDEKLEDLAERFNDFSTISFAYSDYTEKRINQLPLLKQQGIYLIVQEVLNNVVKHSQAKEVTIQAFLSEDVVRVSIEDDGIGYTPNQPTSGIGMANMYKRAELARLKLSIDGSVSGTSVTIETPLGG
ncbi:sensor histidine kinase [Spirosoma endophyticum]|uniref:histidine kinase n=1 Tax=Spirosoma endophyticum TaxID=662367 RepID=A0A1I1LEQ7_9BACT|nr:ATP-binding protein [Spirosoma endophyticum]SFC71002.1 Signal transduction histidine kinase [Spirosoma endophyticum]